MQIKLLQNLYLYLIVGIFIYNPSFSIQNGKVSFIITSPKIKSITDTLKSINNYQVFDSLLARTDTMKYFHLYCMGRDYAQLKPELSVAIADSMILHSKIDKYERGLISGYNLLGIIYTYKDDYIRALSNLKEAMKVGLNSPNSEIISDKYACTLYYLGDLYFQRNDFEMALGYYKKSLEIFNSFTEADLAREDLNFTLSSFAFTTIREDKAYVLYSIGRCYLELKKIDSAKQYIKKSLEIAIKTRHDRLEAKIYYVLSRLEFIKNNIELSIKYLDKSIELSQKSSLTEYEIYNYLLKMEIDLSLSKFEKIKEYYNILLRLTNQMSMKSEAAKAHKLFADYLNKTGNYNEAYKKLEVANELVQQINNEERAREFGQQESALEFQQSIYELEKKAIKSEEKEKRISLQLYFTILILILIIIISLILFINSRKRKKLAIQLRNANIELESANSRLIELNDTKTKLFRIISHDLKNPIKEFEMGVKKLITNPANNINGQLSKLSNSAENIQNLLYSLLNWAESQFDDRTLNLSKINITEVLQNVFYLHKQTIEEKNIRIITNLGVETIVTDINILQIILRNLISNSIKFTPNDGIISITTKSEDDFTILEITDTGIGMDSKQVEAILSDNLNPSLHSNLLTSTGIGLRAVKEYIDQIGGNLFIESTPQKGTTVTVYFS